MDTSKVDYVARKLYEYCLHEVQMELPLPEQIDYLLPTWKDYLPQARVALQAAAEWHDRNGVSR